ncbi:MAG: HNH endonuclease [Pseudonocardiaceae bacterium]
MNKGEEFYSSARWRALRPVILVRDGYRCRIRGPKCRGAADEVDHIVPWRDGGSRWDPANLRACCGPCNKWRANKQKEREGWRRSSTRIVLVVGPVGAGKSTHVAERAGPRDVVVDYDAISRAFGPALDRGVRQRHDVTSVARDAVLGKVRRGEVDAETVWLVSSHPKAESMFPHHEVVVVDPGREEVLRRCGRQRPASFLGLVEQWYQRRASDRLGPSREW